MYIPENTRFALELLHSNGYDAFIVGGCVRDSILGRTPSDWDICSDAKPLKVQELFETSGVKVVTTGLKHGTVTLVFGDNRVEHTTFRTDGTYSDNRRPDTIEFTGNLMDDLSRRDFTINAMAYSPLKGLQDPFNGQGALKKRLVCCVGEPLERFAEDALRILRGIRFGAQLGFTLEENTKMAMASLRKTLSDISKERVRDELNKVLLSEMPSMALREMLDLGVLEYVVPQLMECVGFEQRNPNHDKDVFDHILSVVDNTEQVLIQRLAALFHDIAKPRCFTLGEDGIGHFYDHHMVGADMVESILRELKYDNDTILRVNILVHEHMSRYEKIRNATVNRFIARVGIDNLHHLFRLQIADELASAPPHDISRIIKLKEQCEKILNDKLPLTVKDLAISGRDLIELGMKPGPQMGITLNNLLDKVIEDPTLNTRETLLKIVLTKKTS